MGLIETLSRGGLLENDAKYVYSWQYEMVFIRSELLESDRYDPVLAAELNRQIFGNSRGDRYLDGFRPIYEWTGAAGFRPLDRWGRKPEKVIHLRPFVGYVKLEGVRPVLVRDNQCKIIRLGE